MVKWIGYVMASFGAADTLGKKQDHRVAFLFFANQFIVFSVIKVLMYLANCPIISVENLV
jgi:hypothetical protein